MELFLLLASISFLIIVYKLLSRNSSYWQKRGVAGPKPLPFVGNFLDNFTKAECNIQKQRINTYGRIYGTLEFSRPVLTIADPKLIKEVAISNFSNFRNRHNRNPEDSLFSKTFFLMKDDHWKTLRNLLTPIFSNSRLKNMVSLIEDCAENTLKHISNIENKEIVLKEVLSLFTLDTIARCVFGVNTNAHQNPNDEFIRRAEHIVRIPAWRVLSSVIAPSTLQNSLNIGLFDINDITYFEQLVKFLIKSRKESKLDRQDFLNVLLRLEEDKPDNTRSSEGEPVDHSHELFAENKPQKRKLTEEEIVAQCLLFLLAGFDTTSLLLTFVLYELAKNPEVEEKLYDEISDALKNTEKIDYEWLNSLEFLDAVINESLRMYPPAVAFDRIAENDCTLGESGIKVDRGTAIYFPYYGVHHDPEFFPEPQIFKPERFLHGGRNLIQPYTFLPFGIGPRNCIGAKFALMASKIFLVKLVTQFRVLRTKNTPLKPEFTVSSITLVSKPLLACFQRRQL